MLILKELVFLVLGEKQLIFLSIFAETTKHAYRQDRLRYIHMYELVCTKTSPRPRQAQLPKEEGKNQIRVIVAKC